MILSRHINKNPESKSKFTLTISFCFKYYLEMVGKLVVVTYSDVHDFFLWNKELFFGLIIAVVDSERVIGHN